MCGSRMTPDAAPEVRLENACFFVLAHAGLRASECADLQYQDLDLAGQRLFVRQGKGQKDRWSISPRRPARPCATISALRRGHRSAPCGSSPNGQPTSYRLAPGP